MIKIVENSFVKYAFSLEGILAQKAHIAYAKRWIV